MKKLDQYVVKEMIVPFIIGTFIVVLMFQVNAYIYIAKTFNLDYVPVAAQFQYIMYSTPGYLEMTLPIGSAFAASLAVTRLARESELTAFRVAGASILRVILPIACFGIAVAVGNFYVVERVIPPSTRKARDIITQTSMVGLDSNSFRSNAFLELKGYAASLGTVQRDKKTEQLTITSVLLIDRKQPDVQTIITADFGTYSNGVWTFPKARVFAVSGEDVVSMKVEPLVINERIVLDQFFSPQQNEDVPMSKLRQMIASGKRTGSDVRPMEIQLYRRFAVPASCIVFSLVAPVFAVFFARSGGFVGVLVSFVMVLLYYNAFVISTTILGKWEPMPAWLAAWLPNILFTALGLFAYRRLE